MGRRNTGLQFTGPESRTPTFFVDTDLSAAGGDMTVAGGAQQIALPIARDSPICDLCGPFPDGDGLDNLTAVMSAITGVPRAAYTPLGSQVLDRLFFQHSSRLNE